MGLHAAIADDTPGGGGVLIRVKAVPGSSRDQVAGPLGDRLKVRVSAPPEGGRANGAIRRVLAAAMDVPVRNVQVVSGSTRAEKVVAARGINAATAAARLGLGS